MAEDIPDKDFDSAERTEEDPSNAPRGSSRRRSLTPEQRRFLNQPRSAPEDPRPEPEPAETEPEPEEAKPEPDETEPEPAESQTEQRTRRPPGRLSEAQAEKASRRIELQQVVLVVGVIVALGLTFYFGTKLNYLKSLLASRNKPTLAETGPQFPGVGPDELVRQALVAERDGHWQDAVQRFMAAKRKNLQYKGILFRVGKILYDHRDFPQADEAFERALAFGETTEAASFFRGLIAVRARNLPAAEQFFTAAVAAAPFVSDYHYYCGETLRLDFKPKSAIPSYEQAALLARDNQSAAVCRFKIRMARIEAAEGEAVAQEVTDRQAAGPLPVDWLMTAAALKIREGHIGDARPFIEQARAGDSPGLFASCVNDLYFRDVAKKYPELADVLHLELDLQVPFPE